MSGTPESMLEQLKAGIEQLRKNRHVAFCHPGQVELIQRCVDQEGLGGLLEVRAGPVERNSIIVIDPVAMQKTMDEALARPIKVYPTVPHDFPTVPYPTEGFDF